MLKFSMKDAGFGNSVLGLLAVATLGAAIVTTTDASARGFGGGGHFGGGAQFGGGGFGGHGFGGGVASRSFGGGLAGRNLGGHVGAANLNHNQAVAPSRLRASNVGQNVVPRQTVVNHASTTASDKPRPLPPTPSTPQVPSVLTPFQPPSGGIRLPSHGQVPFLPAKPTPPGLTQPPPGGGHVSQPVQPGKPLPPGIGPSPPPHVLPPPRHAQPVDPPLNPAPSNPPSQHGGPDIGYTGPTIAVGIVGSDPGDDAVIEAPVAEVALSGPICNRILSNGCYFAMRKFSTSNGAELRCTIICE